MSKTRPPYNHAHWDCSNGVSCEAMLSACLDAFEQSPPTNLTAAEVLEHYLDLEVSESSPHALASAPKQYTMEEVCDKLSRLHHFSLDYREIAIQVVTGWSKAYSGSFKEKKQALFDTKQIDLIISILSLLDHWGVKTVSCGPLPLGGLSVRKSAVEIDEPMSPDVTLQLLLGMPTYASTQLQMVTPSAVALLRVLTRSSDTQNTCCSSSGRPEDTQEIEATQSPVVFIPETAGVGTAAKADTVSKQQSSPSWIQQDRVRLMLGRQVPDENNCTTTKSSNPRQSPGGPHSSWDTHTLTLLEANLDDMTAERMAFALDLLLERGAADAWITPIVMKKGRSAHTLHCLVSNNDSDKQRSLLETLMETFFRHTTTLGVRIHRNVERTALRRKFLSIQTPYIDSTYNGIVSVKVGYLGEEVVSVKAEFDHCRAIALEKGVPLEQISNFVVQQAFLQLKETKTSS